MLIVPKNVTVNGYYHRYFCLVIYVNLLNNDLILDYWTFLCLVTFVTQIFNLHSCQTWFMKRVNWFTKLASSLGKCSYDCLLNILISSNAIIKIKMFFILNYLNKANFKWCNLRSDIESYVTFDLYIFGGNGGLNWNTFWYYLSSH